MSGCFPGILGFLYVTANENIEHIIVFEMHKIYER